MNTETDSVQSNERVQECLGKAKLARKQIRTVLEAPKAFICRGVVRSVRGENLFSEAFCDLRVNRHEIGDEGQQAGGLVELLIPTAVRPG